MPVVTAGAPDDFFSIYHVGSDNLVYQHYTSDPKLQDWKPKDSVHKIPDSGQIFSNLTAVSLASGRDHIFGRHFHGGVRHLWVSFAFLPSEECALLDDFELGN